MVDRISRFCADEDGLTSVEYALLLSLVVMVSLTTWQTLGWTPIQ